MSVSIRWLVGATLLALHLGVAAQAGKQAPIPFQGLRTQVIHAGGSSTQQVSFDPALTKVLNERLEAEYNTQGIGGIDMTRVLITRVNRTSRIQHFVYFDPGASNDPAFILAEEATEKPIGSIDADHLLIPGNGFIYAIGRTNKLHSERRKFAIHDGKLEEIKQPFLFVGLESKANVPITLTLEKEGGGSVASIPKGERLFVVLSDGDHMLIKTSFGLLGWFKTSASRDAPEIEGIYFDGD